MKKLPKYLSELVCLHLPENYHLSWKFMLHYKPEMRHYIKIMCDKIDEIKDWITEIVFNYYHLIFENKSCGNSLSISFDNFIMLMKMYLPIQIIEFYMDKTLNLEISTYVLKKFIGIYVEILSFASENNRLNLIKRLYNKYHKRLCNLHDNHNKQYIMKYIYDNPLTIASFNGYLDIIKFLLPLTKSRFDSDVRSRAFLNACKRGHLDCVMYLKEFADCQYNYCEPIYFAVKGGFAEIVDYLIPICDPTVYGQFVCIREALKNKDIKCVKLLKPYSGPHFKEVLEFEKEIMSHKVEDV